MKSGPVQLLLALGVGVTLGALIGKWTADRAVPDTMDSELALKPQQSARLQRVDARRLQDQPFSDDLLRTMWQIMDVSLADKALTPEGKEALEELAWTMDEDSIMQAIQEIENAFPSVGLNFVGDAGVEHSKALSLIKILFERLAQIDTPGALEYSFQMKPLIQAQMFQPAMREWTDDDPTSAYAWIQQNRARLFRLDGPQGTRNESRAIIRMAEHSLPQTFTLLATMPENTQVRAVSSLAHQCAKDSTQRAAFLTQLESLRSTDVQEAAISTVVRDWALDDPLAAAAYVTSRDPADGQLQRTRGALAASWAQSDPVSAIEWLVQHPTPNTSGPDRAMIYAFSVWSWIDSDAAKHWLESIDSTMRAKITPPQSNSPTP